MPARKTTEATSVIHATNTDVTDVFLDVGRRRLLGDKSPLRVTLRAKRFRTALSAAGAEVDVVSLQRALKRGEKSGPATRFDAHAFLRRMRAERTR
ncbi:type II toxin-antitoxin system ParD family antitoxin [Paraburkholderia sp. J11-2]|uniref:type II toxin-antitoxin system ParD family antitoxin n=1 Tax=Paraburkholderia sp. J11-2 TaxID=2805431 RepID=UPI0039F074D7